MILDRSKRFYRLREEFIASESNQRRICEHRAEGKIPQKLSTAFRTLAAYLAFAFLSAARLANHFTTK